MCENIDEYYDYLNIKYIKSRINKTYLNVGFINVDWVTFKNNLKGY